MIKVLCPQLTQFYLHLQEVFKEVQCAGANNKKYVSICSKNQVLNAA